MIGAGSTAFEIAHAVRHGEISAVAVTETAIGYIARTDGELNAFTDVTGKRALAEAAAVDQQVAAGQDPGALAGVPYAVKNLFDIEGLPTLAGSIINRDYAPAATDATLIRRLQKAGAVLLGGLNMGEYAYDFTGENSHYGASRNPHNPEHMAGGSSGGSGTAVAAGMVPLALGSDTNGSIRVPSSFCGLFGLKPTFGRLSRAGTFMFCASLDHLGPFARSVTDLALAYDAMQGPDPADPACSAPPEAEPVLPSLDLGSGGLRIAMADGYFTSGGSEQAYRAVVRVAEALDAHKIITLPEVARARAAAFVITTSESANLHFERLRTSAADFDPDVRDRLLAGALTPASWYLQAQRFRHWYHARVLELFRDVDIILAPATPCSAPKIGQKTFAVDGKEVMLRPNIGIYTQPLSFIGLPIVAVPLLDLGEMPIAVQVIAAPWREDLALRVAAQLESDGVCVSKAVLA
jgi:aspartyl-tRNA(Asn)/glutamyl-tRNA(Gln) amidotransferase subunit A